MIVRFITVARNNLESVILAISILQFIPYTCTAFSTAAVTQLDGNGHSNCLSAVRIISTKPKTTTPHSYCKTQNTQYNFIIKI